MLSSRFREICFNQLVISLGSLQTFEAMFIRDEKFDFTLNETFSMQFTKINENFEGVLRLFINSNAQKLEQENKNEILK